MRSTVIVYRLYSLPSIPFFHVTFGSVDRNSVAKVHVLSFFPARSGLTVQAKISTPVLQTR